MKVILKIKCKKCKSEKISISKKVQGESEKGIIIQETFCHEGFDFDINTFNFKCVDCGSNKHFIEFNKT